MRPSARSGSPGTVRTTVAADCLGRSDEVGAITPGRYADLVAVPGAHLEEIGRFTDVAAVIKGGELIV